MTNQKRKHLYPRIVFNKKKWKGHRLIMHLIYGQIPKNKMVLHHCDNTLCINPDHLYFGTHKDNMRDMTARGHHNTAKLNSKSISKILKQIELGVPVRSIAKKYSMSRKAIYNVRNRQSWTCFTQTQTEKDSV